MNMKISDKGVSREAVSKYQSDKAFSKAISKAAAGDLKNLLLRRSRRLLPFEEVKEKLELWYGKELGVRTVPLDAIIGSQGRYRNFTRHFLPLDENLRDRWRWIETAVSSGLDLPPVALYKVCNAYFVKDGHHRISVAKAKNKKSIEAKVFEYNCDLSLDDKTDLEQIAILETYHRFLKATGLKQARAVNLHLTVLGGYPILMEHIQRHKFYLEKKREDVLNARISTHKAAVSWYDKIYSPMVALIQKNGIISRFPHRTETDFYIWITKYKRLVFHDIFEPEKAVTTIESYAKIFSNPFRKLRGKLRQFFGLVKY